jgi:hypothetical protein
LPSLTRVALALAVAVGSSSCIQFHGMEVRSILPREAPSSVTSPVKAHLTDGSTVVYPRGLRISGDTVYGGGSRYAAGSSVPVPSSFVVLDSVVGMETYQDNVREAPTILASTAATTVGIVATVALLKAIFGSCPTFYSDSAGVPVLEAEGFSYSIAPLFEQRDVDRLRATPDSRGYVTLAVRNEALETHYINSLVLLAVQHDSDEFVAPDESGNPLALRGLSAPASAHDRAGRDIAPVIAAADGKLFNTDPGTIAAATANDLDDYIDITLPAGESDSVAVLLRMRNSLLNTVLLYQQILGDPGARSLDWVGHSLQQISGAIDMGRWYAQRMGMRVSVEENGKYREVNHIADTGPIAFHDVAVLVPVPRTGRHDSVHVRLSFVADEWRIDRVQFANQYRRPPTRTIPGATVVTADASQSASALRDLSEPDEHYVVTSPGQSFTIVFDAGRNVDNVHQTFFIVSQGYYTEWVRGSWIRTASGKSFTPSDGALLDALRRWRSEQPTLEREFYSTRIPVK